MPDLMTRLLLLLSLLNPFLLAPDCPAAEGGAELRFAFQDRIGSVLPIIALKKGFFREEGIVIKALRFSSGPACAEALYTGAADIATMGDTTAIIAVSRGDRLRIIASHATGEHRHRVMVGPASRTHSLVELRGKKVAVKRGTSTYGGLLVALAKQGVDEKEVHIIDLTPPTMTEALLAGSIDAFAASEPTPSTAEQKGARQLATLGGLGNQYPILLLADRRLLVKRPEAVAALLRALNRAGRFAAEHPEEIVAIMAAETGLTPETTRRALARHHYRLRLDQGILDSLKQSAEFLRKQHIIDTLPDFDRVVDGNLLSALPIHPSPEPAANHPSIR